MKCPFCAHLGDKVVDSRESKEGEVIRRRRECLECGRRFTSYERIDEIPYMVVKKDGSRERFERQKLISGLLKACEKRPVSVSALEREGEVLLSFTAPGAVTGELREAIRSGMVVTFTYDIALRQDAFLWFDRTLADVEIAASVRYDNLTRTFHVTRMADGRVTWSEMSTDENQVRGWLTEFDRLKPFASGTLQPNADYLVDVRARISPRRAWHLWPWGRNDATGRASFTYIR